MQHVIIFFFFFHTPLGQPDGSTKNSKYLYVCTTYQKFEEAMCMILFCQESYTHFIQSETSSHKVTGSIRKHPLSKLYPWGIFQRKTVQHYFNTRSGEQPFFFKQWCKESNFSASYYLSWTYSIRTHPLSVLFLYLTGYTHVQHIQHDIPPNKLIRIKSMKQPKPCSIDSFFLFFFFN